MNLLDWLLYARINYWGSHWSANILIAIPVILILIKVTESRGFWKQFYDGKELTIIPVKFFFYFFLDVFLIGTFTASFHEAVFEPVFVVVRLIQNPSDLHFYIEMWNQNIQVWRSFDILFGWTTVIGFAFYWHRMKFRLKDWSPFIVTFVTWIVVFGLPVSLPFPTNYPDLAATFCHDCFVPNFFELMFNLTFAVGIMGAFGVLSTVHYHIKNRLSSEGQDSEPVLSKQSG